MAWRDARQNKSKLALFTSSIILGIASLVAINSFKFSLQKDIDAQAKELLGADLLIRGNHEISDSLNMVLDSLNGERAYEKSFSSMVFFPKNGGTRLVNVRALKGDFPFYGIIETNPPEAAQSFTDSKSILADQTLMLQYEAFSSDVAKLGNAEFEIEGQLIQAPGQSGIAATVAPPVYMPLEYLEETGLEKRGSRIQYLHYFRFEEGRDIEEILETLDPYIESEGLRIDTVEERKEDLGRNFNNLAGFLNLVGFFALLLGSVGVASSVHIYIKEKLNSVAVLRCMGLKGFQAFLIFFIQILGMGFIGSLIGAILGSLVQLYLPLAVKDFLPFEATFQFSLAAFIQGLFAGLVITTMFSLIPLAGVRNISPLKTIRADYDGNKLNSDPLTWLILSLIIVAVFLFGYWQMNELLDAFVFSGFVVGSFLVLGLISYLSIWSIKRFFPSGWSYVARQGLANLYRPNNQTLILVLSIGLGTALISTLFFIQSLLVNQVTLSGKGERPNMILFDIQSDQIDDIVKSTDDFGLPIMQQVPVVTIRLKEINGKSKLELEKDSVDEENEIPDWIFDREYRVTYRDTLIDSESDWKGTWGDKKYASGLVPISIEKDYAERMNVEMGDTLTFNVQGAIMKAEVAHLRSVDWNRVQSNFLVVFPSGVLEEAPQFHVLMTKAETPQKSADYQRWLVSEFPNISAIDITLILNTVDEILSKVAFVIRFMAFFSIATGLIVLIGSVILSKLQKIKESVLLRTLGASRNKILKINLLEYFFLGNLSALTGIALSILGSWTISYFSFEMDFTPDYTPVVYIYFTIVFLTVLIGQANNRTILNNPPLEILRKEAA